MFSGIIEQNGIIKNLTPTSGGALFEFEVANDFLTHAKIGGSIAVNGTCLTVIALSDKTFSADLSNETLNLTIFASSKIGDKVNLEHTLTLQQGIDGHLVSGHIDGLGEIVARNPLGDNTEFRIKIPANLDKYIVKKGSIAVNGISLTVNKIANNIFSVNIIPHTLKSTNLVDLTQGDKVNIEIDLIARHLEKLLAK
jgi:riboflavin synthase